MSRVPKAVALFLVWVLLSESLEPAALTLGVLASLLVVWLNPVVPSSPFRGLPWFRALGYLPWLFGRILASGLHLTRLILDPKLPIAPKLVRHRTDLETDGEIVVLGNSLTLTPGTITVEVDDRDLVVHVIDDPSGEDLSARRFERKIERSFRKR